LKKPSSLGITLLDNFKKMERTFMTLRPEPPYDFHLTASHAVNFSSRYGTDDYNDGVFRRLFEISGKLCLVNVRSIGTLNSPVLEVEILADSLNSDIVDSVSRQASWLLGIVEDLSPFYRMAARDSKLAPIVKAFIGLHIPLTPSVYEGLVMAILGQQISSRVARKLRSQLIENFGPSQDFNSCLWYAFPSPEGLVTADVSGLRTIGLSTRKSEYIADMSSGIVTGKLDLEKLHNQPDSEIVRQLTAIRGVGEWTAQWLLIRSFGRSDGFPYGDLALQRTLGSLVAEGSAFSPDQAREYSQRWSPFRSYVTTYLFAALRSGKLTELLGD